MSRLRLQQAPSGDRVGVTGGGGWEQGDQCLQDTVAQLGVGGLRGG